MAEGFGLFEEFDLPLCRETKYVVYRRAELYNQVWAEPVEVVAARYGVSNVYLAKVCRRLQVPVPGRGYWAKRAAGKEVKTEPLPRLPQGAARHASPSRFSQTAPATSTAPSIPPSSPAFR